MFLSQINKRLETFAADLKTPKAKLRAVPAAPSTPKGVVPLPGTMKTIGVKVDSETYEKLRTLMAREGLSSMKDAALVAIKRGVRG